MGLRANRDGKGADENLTCQTTELLLRLAAGGRYDGVVASPGSGVVESIATHEEDSRELFVVVGHHSWSWGLLGHRKQIVDIFHGAEGFLPELKFDRGVKLSEASIKMMLKSFRVSKVDRMSLVGVFGDVGKVQAERFAKTAELDLSLMLQTEFESLLGDLL